MPLVDSKLSKLPATQTPGSVSKPAPKTKYAKFAQPFVHGNIFRSLISGERKKPLDVKYEVNDLQYHFVAPTLLGVDDMCVLQGLVAVATDQNKQFRGSPAPMHDSGDLDEISKLLAKSVTVQISFNELAREIGYVDNSGGNLSAIRNSIKRLYTTSVFIERLGSAKSPAIEAGRIIHKLRMDHGDKIELSLSPVLSAAVLGGTGQFLMLDMAEIRALTSDVSRLLHMRLLWINPGKSSAVRLETLINYVYHVASEKADTTRRRRSTIRTALDQLGTQLNWTIDEVDGMYRIGRPARDKRSLSRNPPLIA